MQTAGFYVASVTTQWGFVISITIRRKRLDTLKMIKYCKELKKSSKYWIKKRNDLRVEEFFRNKGDNFMDCKLKKQQWLLNRVLLAKVVLSRYFSATSWILLKQIALMASESIAHSVFGLMCYWLKAHSGSRNNR